MSFRNSLYASQIAMQLARRNIGSAKDCSTIDSPVRIPPVAYVIPVPPALALWISLFWHSPETEALRTAYAEKKDYRDALGVLFALKDSMTELAKKGKPLLGDRDDIMNFPWVKVSIKHEREALETSLGIKFDGRPVILAAVGAASRAETSLSSVASEKMIASNDLNSARGFNDFLVHVAISGAKQGRWGCVLLVPPKDMYLGPSSVRDDSNKKDLLGVAGFERYLTLGIRGKDDQVWGGAKAQRVQEIVDALNAITKKIGVGEDKVKDFQDKLLKCIVRRADDRNEFFSAYSSVRALEKTPLDIYAIKNAYITRIGKILRDSGHWKRTPGLNKKERIMQAQEVMEENGLYSPEAIENFAQNLGLEYSTDWVEAMNSALAELVSTKEKEKAPKKRKKKESSEDEEFEIEDEQEKEEEEKLSPLGARFPSTFDASDYPRAEYGQDSVISPILSISFSPSKILMNTAPRDLLSEEVLKVLDPERALFEGVYPSTAEADEAGRQHFEDAVYPEGLFRFYVFVLKGGELNWPGGGPRFGEIAGTKITPTAKEDRILVFTLPLNAESPDEAEVVLGRFSVPAINAYDTQTIFSNALNAKLVPSPDGTVNFEKINKDKHWFDTSMFSFDSLTQMEAVRTAAERVKEKRKEKESKQEQRKDESRKRRKGTRGSDSPLAQSDIKRNPEEGETPKSEASPGDDVLSGKDLLEGAYNYLKYTTKRKRSPQGAAAAMAFAVLSGAEVTRGRSSGSGYFMRKGGSSPYAAVVAAVPFSTSHWIGSPIIRLMQAQDKLKPNLPPLRGTDIEKDRLNVVAESHGVALPEIKKGNPESVRARLDALRALREKINESALNPQAEAQMYAPSAYYINRENYSTEDQREQEEDAYSGTDEVFSRLNPRRPRAPRRERRPRRNPTDRYKEYLDKVLQGKGGDEKPPYDQPKADWRSFARSGFPERYERRSDVAPSEFSARTYEFAPVRMLQRPGARGPLEEGYSQLREQEGFTPDEYRAITRRASDAYTRRAKRGLPASSLLCGTNRTKKLSRYLLPDALRQAGQRDYERKKCVIWISPEGAAADRVMSIRRNVHIDCDFVATAAGNTLLQLVALALQDALLWLAAKDSRLADTYIYVGRVGSPNLTLAWRPGMPVSYEAMIDQINKKTTTMMSGYDAGEDKKNYLNAERGVILTSFDEDEPPPGGTPPSEPTPDEPPPAPPPDEDPFADEFESEEPPPAAPPPAPPPAAAPPPAEQPTRRRQPRSQKPQEAATEESRAKQSTEQEGQPRSQKARKAATEEPNRTRRLTSSMSAIDKAWGGDE